MCIIVRVLQAGKANAVLRRLADAGEVAQCIYFLSDSTLSAFTTGSSLVADAGLLAMLIPNE
jgi:enoyl-[acyl-carrier-protein] reductase (NADH)